MKSLKHVGVLKNTGDRIMVVYREIPGDENYALVVYPDRLPDRYHDRLIDLVESDRAQDTENFFEVLHGRAFHDGNNMLEFLHAQGYLKKVMVDNVTLRPNNSDRFELREYNEHLKGTNPDVANKLNTYDPNYNKNKDQIRLTSEDIMSTHAAAEPKKDSGETMTAEDKAKSLMAQAHLMEQEGRMLIRDAERKREDAYSFDPTLRPKEESSADSEATS